MLVSQFIEAFSRRYKKRVTGIDPEALRFLQGCDWPENLRGLEDCVSRCVLYARGPTLTLTDVARSYEGERDRDRSQGFPPGSTFRPGLSYEEAGRQWEKAYIEDLLRLTLGNVTEAARLGGLARESLQKKIKRSGIDRRRFRPGGDTKEES